MKNVLVIFLIFLMGCNKEPEVQQTEKPPFTDPTVAVTASSISSLVTIDPSGTAYVKIGSLKTFSVNVSAGYTAFASINGGAETVITDGKISLTINSATDIKINAICNGLINLVDGADEVPLRNPWYMKRIESYESNGNLYSSTDLTLDSRGKRLFYFHKDGTIEVIDGGVSTRTAKYKLSDDGKVYIDGSGDNDVFESSKSIFSYQRPITMPSGNIGKGRTVFGK